LIAQNSEQIIGADHDAQSLSKTLPIPLLVMGRSDRCMENIAE
jgi:hypothetical protein